METKTQVVYTSGSKVFLTEEECLHYENEMQIVDFLISKGYQGNGDLGYDLFEGKSERPKHRFALIGNRIYYYDLLALMESRGPKVTYRMCDSATFIAFYENMLLR